MLVFVKVVVKWIINCDVLDCNIDSKIGVVPVLSFVAHVNLLILYI